MQCALDPSRDAGLHPVRAVARRRAGAGRPGPVPAGPAQISDRIVLPAAEAAITVPLATSETASPAACAPTAA